MFRFCHLLGQVGDHYFVVSWIWHGTMFDISFKDPCGCTVLDMLESSEITKKTDWWTKPRSQVACLARSEVLGSLRHYLRVQSQEFDTTDHPKERGIE